MPRVDQQKVVGGKVHAITSRVMSDAFRIFGDSQHKVKVNGIVIAVCDGKKRGAMQANFKVTV